ncbi:MAG: N-acetylmuramoyl-L-alanine amidase CwlD [Terrisporobacter sp.]|uniref:N-acetylmuramoyl-L-alanine amidase CwlD n=1 Tax=Terrisporobacter TaxID=1505652 RepID=UPI0025D73515|nr:N-acetylmuramoyl-L-alanine amidase CwlD [Terrisporobacter othiniensis]MDU2201486.1 N-acetylmuramoyl-L-alanine amidase CwlD [Terrisporobacter othiniensis]
MSKLTKKIIFGIISLVIVIVSVIEVKTASEEVIKIMPITNKTIIVDAGHGGIDPGSMTDDQSVKEKDVNLKITKKVKELLEASGAMVILTRNDDTSLYTEQVGKTIRQKYNENLKNRKKIIQESSADMFISIHLNKFQESKYYGAQTFYPAGKEDDKQLATYIQGELKRVVDKTNNRKIKSTNDIYLIKDNEIPSTLIECGFLSNDKEAKLLNDEEYQDQIAWAIYVGIQKYFSETEQN